MWSWLHLRSCRSWLMLNWPSVLGLLRHSWFGSSGRIRMRSVRSVIAVVCYIKVRFRLVWVLLGRGRNLSLILVLLLDRLLSHVLLTHGLRVALLRLTHLPSLVVCLDTWLWNIRTSRACLLPCLATTLNSNSLNREWELRSLANVAHRS